MQHDEKNELKPWLVKEWCIPKADARFAVAMEDVPEVYQRPYDPLRPVVCTDETNKQLIKETCIPCGPGNPEKLDSVYIRNGAADVFMISEPPAGKRGTVVTKTRKTVDFAQILKYTADVLIYGQKRSFLSQITSISIQQPLYIKHLRQRKHAGRLNGLNGLIPQNTGAG